jgi:hypothetical protein
LSQPEIALFNRKIHEYRHDTVEEQDEDEQADQLTQYLSRLNPYQ